eukprot:1158166-Pelagomonas_calceolata.AAC.10
MAQAASLLGDSGYDESFYFTLVQTLLCAAEVPPAQEQAGRLPCKPEVHVLRLRLKSLLGDCLRFHSSRNTSNIVRMLYTDIMRMYKDVVRMYKDLVRMYRDVVRMYRDVVRMYKDVVRMYKDVVRMYRDVVRMYKDVMVAQMLWPVFCTMASL